MLSKGSLFIQNEQIKGKGNALQKISPITDTVIWKGHEASIEQVINAVKTAKQAQKKWAKYPLEERINSVRNYGKQLEKNNEWLADIISQETGKPGWESQQEVSGMISKIEISIQAYRERCRETNSEVGDKTQHVFYKPLGVVAVLGPFNFPGHIPQGHMIPALIAGNTVVFKPSEHCPKTALAMMHLWEQAQPPASVINMIQGSAPIGQALVVDRDINAIFFTGSEENGRGLAHFMGNQIETLLALELGGNNPIVVESTKYPEAAVDCIIQSAYATAGQRCTCARRLILCESSENRKLVENLIQKIPQLKVGKKDSFMGSLISKKARDVALHEQDYLERFGATVLVEMKTVGKKGAYITPGLIDVTRLSYREDKEIFAPFLHVIWVADIEEAISEANNTKFGLSATLISDNQTTFDHFSNHVKAGVINWNTPTTGASSLAPFGGVGASGNHRPAAYFMVDACVQPIASTRQKKCQSVIPEAHLKKGKQTAKGSSCNQKTT